MPIARREVLAGLAASALSSMSAEPTSTSNTFLELKIWRLHNSAENQSARVSEFLEHGVAPALSRAGGQLAGAFTSIVGPDGPTYVTLAEFASLTDYQKVIDGLRSDKAYLAAESALSHGTGAPFVSLESSLLRSFDAFPKAVTGKGMSGSRVFELRTYQSPSLEAAHRKVGMFNDGEAKIFMRLGFHPVFFGETLIGPKMPNLHYMLSFDSLADHDTLWGAFVSDPEWKSLSKRPGLSDAEIVSNISNVMLKGLPFSPVQ